MYLMGCIALRAVDVGGSVAPNSSFLFKVAALEKGAEGTEDSQRKSAKEIRLWHPREQFTNGAA